jgi:hypothetical protein
MDDHLGSMSSASLIRNLWLTVSQILIMYFISYGSSFMSTNAVFRLPWGLQMIPGIVLLAFLPMMPRSPRWLATQDRWEEAVEVLARLHAKNDTLDPVVIAQTAEIRDKIEYDPGHLWLISLCLLTQSQAGAPIPKHLLGRSVQLSKHRSCSLRYLHSHMVSIEWHKCHDVLYCLHLPGNISTSDPSGRPKV